MKLLFICNHIDSRLKQRVEELDASGIKAHCLILSEFALLKDSKKEIISIENSNLEIIFKNLKYKKLFDSLEKYDGVNIYKSSTICASYIDNIKKISKRYLITADEKLVEKNRNVVKLFDKASCILFENEKSLKKFEECFGYDEKTLIDRDPCYLFTNIDNVHKNELAKFQRFLNVSREKNLVYCDLSTNLEEQITFIDNLLKLPQEQLKVTTFIFDPSSSDIVTKESLIEYLSEKSFDYLLPDSLLTDGQKAMLIVSCDSTMLLPGFNPQSVLYPALYTKIHVYKYHDISKNKFLDTHGVFIDTFENFENRLTFNVHSHNLTDEFLEKNQREITKLFHPKNCLKNYLEVLKIL